jgi:predicted transposase YbfD/YdcC
MDYTTLMAQVECMPQLRDINAHSLYATFEQIQDGRCKRGIRYPLALLLSLIVLAKLAGMDNMNGVVEWVRHRHAWLNSLFGTTYQRWPCFSTYVYALSKLDAQVASFLLSSALLRLQAEQHAQQEILQHRRRGDERIHEHIAFDGKALRGTYGHVDPEQSNVHLCAFYEVKTGIVLAQRDVKEKENEISALKEMLSPNLIKGRILSADAMHTQRFFCQHVVHEGGDYILIAKDNQASLWEDLKLFFEDHAPDVRWQTHRDVSSGHGRLDIRVTTTSPDLRDYLAQDWYGVEQVFCIERTSIQPNKPRSVEVHYGITSLSPTQADAKRIGALRRAHWGIENRLHYRRDVTFKEDASQIRTKNAPAMLAVLHNTMLASLDFLGVTNVASQRRFYDAHPWEAARLLFQGF